MSHVTVVNDTSVEQLLLFNLVHHRQEAFNVHPHSTSESDFSMTPVQVSISDGVTLFLDGVLPSANGSTLSASHKYVVSFEASPYDVNIHIADYSGAGQAFNANNITDSTWTVNNGEAVIGGVPFGFKQFVTTSNVLTLSSPNAGGTFNVPLGGTALSPNGLFFIECVSYQGVYALNIRPSNTGHLAYGGFYITRK